MNNFISTTAGLAALAGVGFTSYEIGQSNSQRVAETIEVRIENSLENVVSDLPQENRDEAKEFLAPVLALVGEATGRTDGTNVNALETELKERLSNISLVSYMAGKSPFIPPVNKVQYLCGEEYALAYVGQYNDTHTS